jgi:hypothetical protein
MVNQSHKRSKKISPEIQCAGCKKLFANATSYYDHVLWCEPLIKIQKGKNSEDIIIL